MGELRKQEAVEYQFLIESDTVVVGVVEVLDLSVVTVVIIALMVCAVRFDAVIGNYVVRENRDLEFCGKVVPKCGEV